MSARTLQNAGRVLLVSLRRLNGHAAWCSNYEFEDVIRGVDDVDVLELEPGRGFDLRHRVSRSSAWRGFTRINPGVKPVRVERDYDLMIFVCMGVWDLLYLNALSGWQDRCKTKVCYMVEVYAGEADGISHFLRRLGDFDHVFQSFAGSVEAVQRNCGKPTHHGPLAADVLRFTPFPSPPPRVIDVLSIGRRSEPVHQALRRRAAAGDLFYSYDTIPGPLVRPISPVEHREMYAAAAKRARYFVAYPAKFGDAENRGQSDVGARYFEGPAAGAVLLGQSPNVPSFRADFPFPDALLEAKADGSDVVELIAEMDRRPTELAHLSRRNAVHALRHHDWAHRWKLVLETCALAPRPALTQRLERLEALAAGAMRTEKSA